MAPGAMWGLGAPASTALCARILPPSSDVSASPGNLGGWQGETVEVGLKAPAWEDEQREKKSPLVESVMPHCSAARTLSPLTFVLRVAQHIQLSRFVISAHILPPRLLETCCLFYSPLAQTPFSPLQLHPLPNRCSVAKLQSTYVTFFN